MANAHRTRPIAAHEAAPHRVRRYLTAMGPGLVTGASDDDPSGVATYAQAGARYRYGLLWLTVLTSPLMCAVQEICDRTALATAQSLGELVVRRFDRAWRAVIAALLIALIAANTLNIAADLVAIGAGMHLLHAGSATLWAAVSGLVILTLLVLGSFEVVARVFKILCLVLLVYVVVLFFLSVSWGSALANLVIPHVRMERPYLALVVAVLGTTISPYLFFWQSEHRVEQLRDEPEGGAHAAPITKRPRARARRKQIESRIDVFGGMALSQLVMFAIILATASTLNVHGITNIDSAAQAAAALRPVAGSASAFLFALGFIAAGFLAVPVLAGSGSAGLAGLLRKPWGYSRSPGQAKVFYGLVAIGTLGGVALTLMSVNPISLLVIVALVNGLAAVPFLILVMIVSRSSEIMGPYTNGRLASTLGWLTVAILALASLALLSTGGT